MSQADHVVADHRQVLDHHRVDLAGHDRRARLPRRQSDLGETGARPGRHQQQVLDDLGQVDREAAQRRRHGEHGRHRLRRLDEVLRGAQLVAGLLGEVADDQLDVLGLGVEARAHRRRADVLLEEPVGRGRDRAVARRMVSAYAANSWPRRMGTASCMCVRPDFSTPSKAWARSSKASASSSSTGRKSRTLVERRHAHRRREDVVGRLGHVDVVVGVDDRVVAALPAADPLRPQDLDRPVGEDLVGVHVVADAGAGLEGIDAEVVDQSLSQPASRLRRASPGSRPRPG